MARYNLGYNFNVHAGVQIGFLISATSTFTDASGQKTSSSVTDQFKTLDFGLPIGVGYEFLDRKLTATLRYIIPISNISTSTAAGQKRNNSVFQASIGIMLYRPI